jgi:hypothetical protein
MSRFPRPLFLALGLMAAVSPAARAMPPGSPEAAEALALCERADRHVGSGRVELLDRGASLAEARVAADPRDALAHFAVFCNLGRRMQGSGFGIGTPFEMLHALRALDAALALAPDDPDVLTAKGAITLELPRLFGGDPDGAEAWFRRALERDPTHARAREYLDCVLGHRTAAVSASR